MLALKSLLSEASAAMLALKSRLSEASAAMLASRQSAREAAQPTARKFVELADFGTIRSRSSKEMEAHNS